MVQYKHWIAAAQQPGELEELIIKSLWGLYNEWKVRVQKTEAVIERLRKETGLMSEFKVTAVRLPENLVNEVHEFANETDASESEALRNLIGLGLEAAGRVDLNHLRLVSTNARANAINRLYEHMHRAINNFRDEESE